MLQTAVNAFENWFQHAAADFAAKPMNEIFLFVGIGVILLAVFLALIPRRVK